MTKRSGRRFLWCALPLVVLLALWAALYIPPVQRWALGRLLVTVEGRTGLRVSAEGLRLSPLCDVDAEGLLVTQGADTLLEVERAAVDLNFRGLLSGRIGIDGIRLEGGRVDSHRLWDDFWLRGQVGSVWLRADELNLRRETLRVNEVGLADCDLDMRLGASEDVEDEEDEGGSKWRIAVDDLLMERTRVRLVLTSEAMAMDARVRRAELTGADIRLGEAAYRVERLTMDGEWFRMDLDALPRQEAGLDLNHVALSDISLGVRDFLYNDDEGCMEATLWSEGVREACGLTLTRMEAGVRMQEGAMEFRSFGAETPYSSFRASGRAELSAFETGGRGTMDVEASLRLGREDLLAVADGSLSDLLKRVCPDEPLCVDVSAQGNVDSMRIDRLVAAMEDIAHLEGKGWVAGVTDSTRVTRGEAEVDLRTEDLSLVNRLAGSDGFVLPPMTLSAKGRMKGDFYDIDALLKEDRGLARLTGSLHAETRSYDASLRTSQLDLNHFLPDGDFGAVSLSASARGRGFDPFDARTKLDADVEVSHLDYGGWALDSMAMVAKIEEGRGRLEMKSENDLIAADGCAEADMARTLNNGVLDLDLRHLDAKSLGLTNDSLLMSMTLHAEGESDLKETHRLKASLRAQRIELPDTVYYPHDMTAQIEMSPTGLSADINAGDFEAKAKTGAGLEQLQGEIEALLAEVAAERREYHLRQDTLKTLLPDITLHIRSGRDNPLGDILHSKGYTLERFEMDLKSDTIVGLNGDGRLWGLNTGAILLDTIEWRIFNNDERLRLDGRVRNSPKNKVVSFETRLAAELTATGTEASLLFYDARGRKGMDLGLRTDILENGTKIHFTPYNPIIAYRKFKLNENNFIAMTNDMRIEAMVDLLADDGTGLKLYSTESDALQDLTLNLNHFNVGELTDIIPYMPKLGGLLHGDLHYLQTDSATLSISTDIAVERMKYEKADLGDVGLNAVYLPNNDGTHFVDGILTQNGNEVMFVNGTYRPEKDANYIEGKAQLERLPMSLTNGFIPDAMAKMEGFVNGELEIGGTTDRPMLTGMLTTDSMRLTSVPYNLNLTFPNDTLQIRQSHIDLDRIEAYAMGKEPLTLDGTIDFSNTDAISLDITVSAKDYQLINAPKTRNALAYGKANVDMRGRLRGTLDHLTMRGRLTVLGTTDLTYVLQDSPLTVEDRLADLVTFVDFNDTIETQVVKTKRQFVDMQLTIAIEQAAQVHCLLSESGQDYINLEGGGDLVLSYDNDSGLKLNGRYAILSGDMNYTVLPVVGSKHFKIESGSYVEFRGEMSDPYLNIKASERMRSSVSENNVPRSVAFDVGLIISQTLSDMGLEFTLSAPEDLTIQNQLAAMSAEDRGRVAVTMLATGMYLNDLSSSGGFSTSNTLNTYLQNEINNLVGRAQNTIDVNVGIENTTSESGASQTDYSFSFAKRFWGNRISIIVGGRVRTGEEAQNTGESIIDNISLEYRLDQSATRYVKLYYDHNYESLLEGEITEMGAGVVFRKKTDKLSELFIFRKPKTQPVTR